MSNIHKDTITKGQEVIISLMDLVRIQDVLGDNFHNHIEIKEEKRNEVTIKVISGTLTFNIDFKPESSPQSPPSEILDMLREYNRN